ncbi:beta-1,4-N-acetylgalactosaminyltransferase bre-4-like isoform X2 [Littorina saxatilis]|uniref:beta-1,4-N-acetylgalactosaminyltransferase bre-4-like isoform X2 n=1 Tax=Littorina saxatilis TaxID=31220 RepID=UPI0038B54E75
MVSAQKTYRGFGRGRSLMLAVLLMSVVATSCQILIVYHRHWVVTMEVKMDDNVAPFLSSVREAFNQHFENLGFLNRTGSADHRLQKKPSFQGINRIVLGAQRAGNRSSRSKETSEASSEQLEIANSPQMAFEKAQTLEIESIHKSPRIFHVPRNHTTEESGTILCPETPPNLLGNVSSNVNAEYRTLKLNQVMARNTDLNPGGEWSPKDCVARYRLAIVIPYRDRLAHLTVLLAHLLPILKRQQLHFRIFVVEQHGNQTFNKGRIMNAAFKEALKMYDFHCVIFHDVDLIPEDDRNMYTCPVMPRHMSVAVDSLNYRLPYSVLVGGVLNLRVEHFQQVNGYSNMYWGWGAEDDDMGYRIRAAKLKITRPPTDLASQTLLKTAMKRYHEDGLNNLNYTVQFIHLDPLYTHIMVDTGEQTPAELEYLRRNASPSQMKSGNRVPTKKRSKVAKSPKYFKEKEKQWLIYHKMYPQNISNRTQNQTLS